MALKGLDDFKARVKRIESPRNVSYFDPDLEMHVPKHISSEKIRQNGKARKISIMALIWSLLIGGAGLMIAQALRYRYLGMAETGNATLFTDLLIAAFLILTWSAMVSYRRVGYRMAQVLGAGAMFVAGHNLMWYYPDQLAVIYTTQYVEIVRENTVPMSLVFRDMTISL